MLFIYKFVESRKTSVLKCAVAGDGLQLGLKVLRGTQGCILNSVSAFKFLRFGFLQFPHSNT